LTSDSGSEEGATASVVVTSDGDFLLRNSPEDGATAVDVPEVGACE
jgi:hypothetical protein